MSSIEPEIMEACPFHAASPETIDAPRDLEPLTLASDRRDVQRRLVGPLNAIATLCSIEQFKEYGLVEESSIVGEELYESSVGCSDYEGIFHHMNVRFNSTRHNVVSAVKLNYGDKTRVNFPPHTPYVSENQHWLLDTFTFNTKLPDMVEEGLMTQFNLTFNVALPGYLAETKGLKDGKAITKTLRELGREGLAQSLEEPDFVDSLSQLAITANGLYEQISNPYADHPDKFPILYSTHTEEIKGKIRDLMPRKKPTIYDLYEQDTDGSTTLSKMATDALRKYIYLRNRKLGPEDLLAEIPGASKGCPVVQKVAYLREDDLTDYQWKDLTEGDDPIASYDEKTKKLIFKRFTIPETNQFFADLVRG